MDQTFELHFQEMQQLDSYCENGKFEDMPLSNEFLDDFGMASHQLATPGGLPSPNSTNPDLPGSGRQSPFLPDLSTLTDGYGSQQSDTTSGADSGPLDLHLLQQSQELRTFKSGSNASISHPSTNQSFSNASNDCSQAHVQQWEPSMTSSYPTNAGQYEAFMAPVPSEGSLCISNDSLQSRAATVPSNGSFKQKTPTKRPTSTHLPIAPKVVHNTSSVSAPANSPHSPTSKSQHFIPHPSHLRHQVHPELLQYSPFPVTATDHSTTGQVAHTMSSTHNFTNSQEPNASPSRSDYQHVQQSSNRPPFRRITSGHNQSRGSPNSQNYQPFQESSLRTSVTANPDRDLWEAGQFQTPEYPDPQPTFQHQSNRSPYMVHNVISGFQGNATVSDSPEQYRTRPSDSEDASFMSQEPRDFGFNGSSPMSIKHEVSSPYSDHVVSPPKFQSPLGSPKSQKKRRVKQESKNNDDNEVAVDAVALQTADLTSLSSTDHTNVAALINAMHNTDNVEDNLGMQKTWERVRRAKALRIREVCVDLLNLTKLAQQQKGTPLGEKRPINQYASFAKRFDALCETLKFQKTVCKHLIEPPYSYGVVDDPQSAKDRVKNNRRVNYQKAEAIRLGREHLGERGQGRGKPMLKTKKREQGRMEESQDEEENSENELLSDGETDVSVSALRPKSARPNPHTPKRIKRSTNSNQHQEQKARVQAASYMPQVQNLDEPFARGLNQNVYAPTQQTQMLSEHDRMLHGLAAGQQMSTLNQRHNFRPGNESGNSFYGDTSTGGSDSEGLGSTGYGYC